MRYDKINIGDVLELSPERRDAYGMQQTQITVTGLKARPGYKVGHIVADAPAGEEAFGPNKDKWFFKASDFVRRV